MLSRLTYNILNIYNVTFALIFLWLFVHVLFENKIYPQSTLFVLFNIGVWSTATAVIYKMIKKFEQQLNARPILYGFGFISIIFVVQLYFGYELAVQTAWDTEAVYRGAVNLMEYHQLQQYQNYFELFPHNMGATVLLSVLFRVASIVGVTDYYWVGTIYNVLCINAGFLFVFLICRELKNNKAAFMALWLCASCLPLYFYTPIFYTDTLSFPFVALVYYLYLKLLKTESLSSCLIYGSAVRLACAVGALIKYTVVIVAIAILIDVILLRRVSKYWSAALSAIVVFQLISMGFNSYIYAYYLQKEVVEKQHVPYSHWVMMGLEGNGAYNDQDYQFTYSFTDPSEKVKGNLRVIAERLKNFGVWGYLEFADRKQQLNFGSGIYAVNEMIDDGPTRETVLHDFGLGDGKYFEQFRHVSQGYHVYLFLLIIVSALLDGFAKNYRNPELFSVRLAVLGIFMFLMMWEASSRYIINYLPVFIVCAACGYEDIHKLAVCLKNALRDYLGRGTQIA